MEKKSMQIFFDFFLVIIYMNVKYIIKKVATIWMIFHQALRPSLAVNLYCIKLRKLSTTTLEKKVCF